jgi:hypothetical protein
MNRRIRKDIPSRSAIKRKALNVFMVMIKKRPFRLKGSL